MKNSKYNFHHIIFSLIFLALGMATLYISFSKYYLRFLTPSSLKYLVFMGGVLVIYAFVELWQSRKKGTTVNLLSSIVVLIPLAMLFIPNLELDASHLGTGYAGNMGINPNKSTDIIKGENMTFIVDNKPQPAFKTFTDDLSKAKGLKGIDKEKKTIVISDEQFYDWTAEIFANSDKYLGYTITVNGMVFIDKQFMGENQFVPARLLMSCCAADALPSGLISNYKDVDKLKAGDYVMVTGTLTMGSYNSQKGPVIDVKKIDKGKKPENLYVYPN